jgi:choloylglycine hydrolase
MDTVTKSDDSNESLASALSVTRSGSVPVGITTPGRPNIAATQWRTMADHKNMAYFFKSAFSPCLFWAELKNLDFNAGSPVKKLSLTIKSAALIDGKFVSGGWAGTGTLLPWRHGLSR